MESVRNISGALTAIHSADESGKTVRTSWSILRCFLFFDICYLMSSVTLIVMALTDQTTDKESMILCGGAFGIFATISAMCNSLACHGLRCWKRSFLIPWLSFYLMVLGVVTTCSLQALYSHNFLLEWRHVFLFFAIFTIFYCWSHLKKQFLVMAYPRPDQVALDIESVVRDFLRPSWYGTGNRNSNAVSQSPPGDLPPKYEELGKFTPSSHLMMMMMFIPDLPPQYDESMSANLPAQSSSSGNQGSDGANQESPSGNTRSQDH